MNSINLKSVLICGLVAGIIINISGLSMIPAVGGEMNEVLAARGLPPLSKAAIVFIILVSMSIGLFQSLVYSLLKTQLKSRFKATLVTVLIVWLIAYVLSNVSLAVYGFMPLKLVVLGTLWGLGELLLAGFVGMKIYRDKKTISAGPVIKHQD